MNTEFAYHETKCIKDPSQVKKYNPNLCIYEERDPCFIITRKEYFDYAAPTNSSQMPVIDYIIHPKLIVKENSFRVPKQNKIKHIRNKRQTIKIDTESEIPDILNNTSPDSKDDLKPSQCPKRLFSIYSKTVDNKDVKFPDINKSKGTVMGRTNVNINKHKPQGFKHDHLGRGHSTSIRRKAEIRYNQSIDENMA